MSTLGQRIKNIRLSLGLTQTEFGEKISLISEEKPISKGTVNNWEHDRNKPNPNRRIAISILGNVSYDTLKKSEEGSLYKILNRYLKDNDLDTKEETKELVRYYKLLENTLDDDMLSYHLSSFMRYLDKMIELKSNDKLKSDKDAYIYKEILNQDFQRLSNDIFD